MYATRTRGKARWLGQSGECMASKSTRTVAPPPQGDADKSSISRIIDAAYECFQRFGIKKTTVEDIATLADVSRPTVYRYFLGKEDILRQVCELEVVKVHEELRRRISPRGTLAERLTETLLVSTRIAHDNKFVRILIESPSLQSRSANPSSPDFNVNRAVWGNVFDVGLARGELAGDLTPDEIASWLILAESILLIKIDAVTFSDDELRRFIRRFIVMPILGAGGDIAPARDASRPVKPRAKPSK